MAPTLATLMQRRRALLSLVTVPLLSGCGFALQGTQDFAFGSLYIEAADSSPLGQALRRSLAANGKLQLITDAKKMASAQAVLVILSDQREKAVAGLTPAGQVTEFQLRLRIKFRLRTPQGKTLIEETEILQKRDLSFSESAALAKEAEQDLLYRDMQADTVQQVLRRLAAVKQL